MGRGGLEAGDGSVGGERKQEGGPQYQKGTGIPEPHSSTRGRAAQQPLFLRGSFFPFLDDYEGHQNSQRGLEGRERGA